MQTLQEQEPNKTLLPPVNLSRHEEQTPAEELTTVPKTTGQRIVSKGAYAKAQMKRIAMLTGSYSTALIALIWAAATSYSISRISSKLSSLSPVGW